MYMLEQPQQHGCSQSPKPILVLAALSPIRTRDDPVRTTHFKCCVWVGSRASQMLYSKEAVLGASTMQM